MVSIDAIDLNWLDMPQAIAAYLVRGPAGAVLVETGPGSTIDALERGLRERGVEPGELAAAIVSHIHLDHAGAAWWIARHGVPIHVHEFGARHLVDPSRLNASAERIYGDDMQRLWGDLQPIDEALVHAVGDNDVIEVAGLSFRAIETPGHARHHHAFALNDGDRRICFTGDAAAMIGPGVDSTRYISLPTPPPEFDLRQWLVSVDRLDAGHFDQLYLTHFGRLDNAAAHFAALRTCLKEHAEFITSRADTGDDRESIVRAYGDWVRRRARAAGLSAEDIARHVSFNLVDMNVTGVLRWHNST